MTTRLTRSLLTTTGNRRFWDFGRASAVEDASQLETQVLEVTVRRRIFPEFLNDGMEAGSVKEFDARAARR
jgi:hypothetical protein